MDDHQYGMMNLTQYVNGIPVFASVPPHLKPDLLCRQHQNLDMVMANTSTVPQHDCLLPHHHHEFLPDSSTAAAATVSGGGDVHGGDGGNGRWPRQETLTFLEVRSRLDSKFKEANQKGPLWDEVSRIMSEEYGYRRSGKKCKEKFENLFKYYKKTKEGKAGKHYRYFRQLEALYDPKLSHSLISLSDSEDTTNDSKEKRRGKRSWKAKTRDLVDIQMRKLMEKQEIWLEKMMKVIEDKEQERILREEEWREKKQKFWASERAWIEARDAALIHALHKLNGEDQLKSSNNLNDYYLSSSCYYNFQKNEEGSETSRHVPNLHGLF